jgi:chromate transporter
MTAEEGPKAAGAAGDDARQVTLPQILALFARIGLTSCGGGLSAWIFREVVDRRGWLSEEELLGGLTLCQIIPGPNVVNLSIYIGQRLRGARGAAAAVCALLLPPLAVAVLMAATLHSFRDIAWLHNLLEGVAAGAIGLTISVGYRSARRATESNRWAPVLVAAVFLAVGVLRWPMLPVVIGLAPVAVLLARRRR